MFRRLTRQSHATTPRAQVGAKGRHCITSEFSTATCRFELACSCGSVFDTNHIDEALEWHELHITLAPLSDQLDANVR